MQTWFAKPTPIWVHFEMKIRNPLFVHHIWFWPWMVSITCNFIFLIKDNNSNFPISYFFIYSTRMPLATSPVYPWMVCTLCYQTFNLRRNFVVGNWCIFLTILMMLMIIFKSGAHEEAQEGEPKRCQKRCGSERISGGESGWEKMISDWNVLNWDCSIFYNILGQFVLIFFYALTNFVNIKRRIYIPSESIS